jgi:hypothetical protein
MVGLLGLLKHVCADERVEAPHEAIGSVERWMIGQKR